MVGGAGERNSGVDHPSHGRRESLAIGEEDGEVVQPGGARRGSRGPAACPGVEADVVMIAAGREEHGIGAVPRCHLEAQNVPIECERAVEIGYGQMHVADAGLGVS